MLFLTLELTNLYRIVETRTLWPSISPLTCDFLNDITQCIINNNKSTLFTICSIPEMKSLAVVGAQNLWSKQHRSSLTYHVINQDCRVTPEWPRRTAHLPNSARGKLSLVQFWFLRTDCKVQLVSCTSKISIWLHSAWGQVCPSRALSHAHMGYSIIWQSSPLVRVGQYAWQPPHR